MGQKRALLDEDEGPNEEQPLLRVNEQYAKRFEHNKRREELHRLQEKHPEAAARLAKAQAPDDVDVSEASSSDDDDDDEEALADDTDKVLETLVKIRRQDPSIYNAETRFFASDDEEEGDEERDDERPRKKAKPLYLRDAIAKQALEGGEASSSDDEEGGRRQGGAPTYTQEQQELKRAFLDAAEQAAASADGAGDNGDFAVGLLKKKRRREGKAAEHAAGLAGKGKQPVEQLLHEYFGGDKSLDQGEAFLKSYILHKGWVDTDDAGAAARGGYLGGEDDESEEGEEKDGAEAALEKDEEFLEEVDRFEAAYNFRYEEPGGATIVTHPRNIEGTVRKEDDRRKRARKEKAERKAAEQQQREQEIRRLKNLKMGEIQERLAQIQAVAGKSAPQDDLVDALMDEDWDPDKYDAAMAAAFNDDYYEAGEEDDPGALEALSSDDLEEEEHADEDDAVAGTSGDGFNAVRKKLQALRQGGQDEGGDASDEEADAEVDAEELARQRAEIQRMMEEYYKLDYEDNIDGIRCRFRYREVPKATGGLSVEDILTLPDKELNQVVGLKKLAPYREDGTKVRPNYKALQSLKAGTGANGQNVAGKEWHRHWKGRKEGQLNGHKGQQQQQQQWPRDGKQGGKPAGKHGHGPAANSNWKGGDAFKGKRPEQPNKQWQGAKKQHHGQQPLGGMTEEERLKARQSSYAKLTLSRGGAEQAAGQNQQQTEGKARKREEGGEQQQQQQQPATPAGTNDHLAGLTKAQRKNYKRSLKRSSKASAAPEDGIN